MCYVCSYLWLQMLTKSPNLSVEISMAKCQNGVEKHSHRLHVIPIYLQCNLFIFSLSPSLSIFLPVRECTTPRMRNKFAHGQLSYFFSRLVSKSHR